MDRKWMSMNRLTKEYRNGVKDFIQFAMKNDGNSISMLCPCIKCFITTKLSVDEVKNHLIVHGIDETYSCWYLHGEIEESSSNFDGLHGSPGDKLEEMAQAVEENFIDCPSKLEQLLSDAREHLYPSCPKFTKLSAVLKLYNLKAANGWTMDGQIGVSQHCLNF